MRLPSPLPWLAAATLIAGSVGARQSVQPPPRERFQLYLLMGQSNMVGRGPVEEQDRVPHPRVLMFTPAGEWAPAVDPVHLDQRGAGVCLGSTFARAMADADATVTIGLIPTAVNGTPLARWQKGQDLYERAVVRAKAALEDGTLAGILWHQGESDTHEEQNARTYAARLAAMVTDLRADLGAPDAPFVAGQVGEFLYKGTGPDRPKGWVQEAKYWPVVNEQISSVPGQLKASAAVSSSGLTDYDTSHFDTPSLREIGRRYAKAMLGLKQAAKPAGSAACAELPQLAEKLDGQARQLDDWPFLRVFRKQNAELPLPRQAEARVVFLGASITGRWMRPEAGGFFPGKPYVNRGSDGQLLGQMLLRFHQDVVALQPALVVIHPSLNDVVRLAGQPPENQRGGSWPVIEGHIASLVELARAHGMRVVLASSSPVSDRRNVRGQIPTERVPPERTARLAAFVRDYAARNGLTLLDYYAALADERGLLREGVDVDGSHMNAKGYAIMAPLTERAIAEALARPAGAAGTKDVFSSGAEGVEFPGARTPRACEEIARLRAKVARNDRLILDWPQMERYAAENAGLPPADGRRVVFLGDSITQLWSDERNGGFFPGKPYVNRGIGGQTSAQMLVRFRQDVIELKPKAVVILAGVNDMGGTTGATTLLAIEHNLATMAELARLHGIRVVLASLLPVSDDDRIRRGNPLRPTTVYPPEQIVALNRWLAEYAARNDAVYLDYHAAMADARGLLKDELTDDGLHPNAEGYKLMSPLAERAIEKALGAL